MFVPRHPDGLEGTVQARARQMAIAELAPVRHTMALKAQPLTVDADDRMLADLVDEFAGTPRRLWD